MNATAHDIADRIVAEHDARVQFAPLDARHRGDLDLAYEVQDEVLARWIPCFGAIASWKVGLTTPRMQQMCGVSQPIAGAILAQRIHASPASVRAADFVRFGLESEMSFRVGQAPRPGVEWTAATVRDFLDAACASFELIDDRAADYATLDAASMIADNSWNGGMVRAEPVDLDHLAATTGIGGVLRLDGQEIDRGSSEDAGGDPLAIVAWLANSLAARGRGLELGQWIMTGSIVPTRFPKPGETYEFTFDGFAPARLEVV